MISLAAGAGDYLFLVVMLVFGLINWVANKVKEGKQPPPKPTARPAPRPVSAPSARDPEDDRMRRFLEALGVPGDAREAPAPPFPVRPAPVTRRAPPPPLPLPSPPRDRSLDDDDAASAPGERIHLRELQTTAVPEFQTVSSRVAADSDEDFRTVSSRISAVPTVAPVADPIRALYGGEALSGSLFTVLRSPVSLRQALVLREILGPPRSLQTP